MADSSGDASGGGVGRRRDDDVPRVSDARLRRVRSDGTPVYGYEQRPGRPAVGVLRLTGARHGDRGVAPDRHAHEFHVLVYVQRGESSVVVDGVERVLRDGDVAGVAPGRSVEAGAGVTPADGLAWSVHFLPDVVPALTGVSLLAWSRHPLLRVFSPPDGADRLSVAVRERPRWDGWFEDLAEEVAHPERTGSGEAVAAGLTRILVAAARLVPGPASNPDPLVLRVFDRIEDVFAEQASAGDVARALGYTPGHLTTVVRERSGRTVGEWLTERRLVEARRLLLETDLPLGAVAARTGLRDGTYLGRRFRDRYGTPPDRWRRERR